MSAGRSGGRRRLGRFALRSGIVLVVAFGVLQLVPAGRSHSNPPVTADAPWPSEAARSLAVDACYDCHSNETDWPLYSYVAPASWLVTRDVEAGRDRLNFSEWDPDAEADDAAEAVVDRSMPPSQYTRLHPDARLSAAERDLLVASLTAMEEGEDGDGGGDGGQGRGRGRGRGGD